MRLGDERANCGGCGTYSIALPARPQGELRGGLGAATNIRRAGDAVDGKHGTCPLDELASGLLL